MRSILDMYGFTLLRNGYPEQALGECSTALKLALPDIEGQRMAKDIAQTCATMANVIRMQALRQR